MRVVQGSNSKESKYGGAEWDKKRMADSFEMSHCKGRGRYGALKKGKD